ncbi:hypothetical protein FNY66_00545 [Mediterraneibacter catenae]|uniref:Transglutaminase-like domain-containing protein n=1 Tax=Mediterraneibacter catenae TaxID=2594882 RepID=A0A5M9I419_9FIRM|nr:hypothetical protein [Mediterraneibacter catenae]KAA8502789.1 hypothetical protein FNY66_00545 [Mediterraneibacter catenae]
MKRNSKRFLSLFLAVPMTLSLMSMPVSAAPTGSADQQVQEETAAPETSEDTQEDADTDTAEETQDSAAGADQESSRTETDTETSAADNAGEDAEISINLEDSLTTFTVDASKIEAPEITPNEMQLSEEELDAVDTSDPEIATIEEELKSIKVLDAEGNSVALTDEQIQTVLGMYTEYQQQWQANADVLGVQSPFYLMFNDNGEDGLGVLGEMLCLAGVSVEDVRSGNYSYDDLTGMIMNFLYGDQFAIEYYAGTIRTKRDEALKAVEDSGAQTDVQKIMALNSWLAQNSSFDMSYIMNQMDPENPIMAAEEPQQHEYYDEIYAAMEEVYRPQIEKQFQSQFKAVAEQQVSLAIYQNAIKQILMGNGSSEEEADAYLQEHAAEISENPHEFIAANFGGEEVAAGVDEQVNAFLQSEDGQAAVDQAYTTIMDTQIPDLGNMTPNQAIEVYVEQAASGLTNGILGYWEGNHIGALAEGKAVCMGYAKAFAYLMQCMYPEYYLKDGATDITVAENWKTASELYYDEEGNLDIDQDYNVDLVRITFDAAVSMYGIPQPDFSSDHFWNAVKVDGKWYYVDPCYTDVFSEVMNRDRVETDGYMNHTYFMISHSSLAEMFDGNYKEIKTLYADCTGSTVNADYTSSDYEGSWVTRAVSNVYSDGTYMYYMYDSTDMLDMLRQFNDSEGNYQDMDIEDAVYKIVRHQMDGDDMGDGDEDYETLIDFNSDESGSVMVRNAEGEMVANEMLTELYAQFVEEQSVYPAIHTTPVLYEGKLYFNVSNCILSYDLESGEVVKVKEYNTVSATRDKTEVFGAMAFDVVDNAEGADFTFENHPIAGMTLKGDTLYVDIATNLSYIAGKADLYDYASEGYGYAYEESNYNPNYNEFSAQMMEDQGISDDMLEQLGYKREINDNSEFMWVANAVETMDMGHFAGTSHTYEDVTVDAYCGRDGYTESRCTECGAIEADSRVPEEGTAHTHHYLLYQEKYYTTEDDVTSETDPSTVTWNSGESYVCAECGFHISEPTEPKKNGFVTDEEYEEQLAEYEKNKEIYDEAVKTAGHTYEAADAKWSDDCSTVTFSNLVCSAICEERKETLDLLRNDNTISVTLDTPETAEATLTSSEGECTEGATATYTAEGEVNGIKYSLSTTKQLDPGQHPYVGVFTWTEVTNDDGSIIGYTATATATCSSCGDKHENIEAEVVKDEENSKPATDEEDGKDIYVATAVITDENGEVLGTVTETKEVIIPATGQDVEDDFTGLRKMDDGVWYYFVNGVVQTEYTGLVKHTSGTWYYVVNGVIDFEATGLYKHSSGSWYYVKDGKMQSNYTGLVKHTTGSWYYVVKGKIDYSATGLFKHVSGSWYYVKEGRMQSSYTGLVKHTTGSWYYVEKGKINYDKTGLIKHVSGTWYYVVGGRMQSNYTGLVKHTTGSWYYVEKGKMMSNYTGLAKHTSGTWYYVVNGKWNSSYNGTTVYNGKTYTVRQGKKV